MPNDTVICLVAPSGLNPAEARATIDGVISTLNAQAVDFFGSTDLGVQINGIFASVIEHGDSESADYCHKVGGALLSICLGLCTLLVMLGKHG